MKRVRSRAFLALAVATAVSAGWAVMPVVAKPAASVLAASNPPPIAGDAQTLSSSTPAGPGDASGEKPKGKWTKVANMTAPRAGHTATLLRDGRVLVAGGCTKYEDAVTPAACSEITSSSEVFDPSSGKWTKAQNMHTGRFSHTATLLRSGLVLVAGGCIKGANRYLTDCTEATASTEVFDPKKGTWTKTADMQFPRVSHTAIALIGGKALCGKNCGKVLVTGGPLSAIQALGSSGGPLPALQVPGVAGGSGPAESERYDPKTKKWTGVGNPPGLTGFLPEAALLADGRVMVTGASTDFYSPVQNKWEAAARKDPLARAALSATVLKDGKVLVAGGALQNINSELFDPTAAVTADGSANKGKWQPIGALRVPRQGHRAVLLKSGDALVIGGATLMPNFLSAFLLLKSKGTAPDSLQVSEPAELYEVSSGKWTPAAPMLTGRMTGRQHPMDESLTAADFTATLLKDGRVLVTGGKAFLGDRAELPLRSQKQDAVSEAEAYTPEGLVAGKQDAGRSDGIPGSGLPGGTALLLGLAAVALAVAVWVFGKKVRRAMKVRKVNATIRKGR